jgi:hypothetical protein
MDPLEGLGTTVIPLVMHLWHVIPDVFAVHTLVLVSTEDYTLPVTSTSPGYFKITPILKMLAM